MAAEGKNSDLWRAIREELVLPLVRWAVPGDDGSGGSGGGWYGPGTGRARRREVI